MRRIETRGAREFRQENVRRGLRGELPLPEPVVPPRVRRVLPAINVLLSVVLPRQLRPAYTPTPSHTIDRQRGEKPMTPPSDG